MVMIRVSSAHRQCGALAVADETGSTTSEIGAPAPGGFTLLDGAAFVLGSGVATIHFREIVRNSLSTPDWVLMWLALTGVALSAAGPFVLLERLWIRRTEGYPRAGDWLWAVIGLPWLLAAPLRPSAGRVRAPATPPAGFDAYRFALWIALGLACTVAVVTIWRTWVALPPHEAAERSRRARWTERVGTILAVAWPLQCGFGLVVAE